MKRLFPILLALTTSPACGASSEPGDTALADPSHGSGRHAPFEQACARLHGDCASVCGSPFFECYEDARTCAEQWELDFFSDYADPLVDEELAERCAEQVHAQACTSLEPDTLECEYALIESCTGDRDGYGRPYSPFRAAPVDLDESLAIDLCPSVAEYYAVQLPAGARLEVAVPDDAPPAFFTLHQLAETAGGDAVLHRFDLEQPVPVGGEYLVEVRALHRSEHDLRLVVAGAGE